MYGEWTYEGGEKAQITEQVIPDGIRGRYPGGAHDGACRVDVFASMWVVPQICIFNLSHGRISMGQIFLMLK
mgnify:CR=1 FL=1